MSMVQNFPKSVLLHHRVIILLMKFVSMYVQRKQICHLLVLWIHQPITFKAEQSETQWHSEIVMVDQIEKTNFSSIKCSWQRQPRFVQMMHIQLIPVALDQDSFPCRLIAQRMSSDQSWEAWLSELCIWAANSTAGDTVSSLQARRLISQLAIKCAHYNSKGKCPGIIQKNKNKRSFSYILFEAANITMYDQRLFEVAVCNCHKPWLMVVYHFTGLTWLLSCCILYLSG